MKIFGAKDLQGRGAVSDPCPPCVRGEQVLSWLSGIPQKSHGEFCGKRSGRRIRSCGKRSAPQTKPPCRDEVGSLPLANLETAHSARRFRAPAQIRSRCVGRGAARALPRETVPSEARREGCKGRIYASKTTLPSGSFLACHLPLHRGG